MNHNFPYRPLSVLIKPTSSRCNLNCGYCFYLRKAELYPWSDHPTMTLETYEAFVRQYVEGFLPPYGFNWQGGEPTMMGLDFYRGVVDLQQQVWRDASSGRRPAFTNSIQTNGTLLNDDWASFFTQNRWLVGVSIDGPPELHDDQRVDWSDRPTHDRVMDGVEFLRSRGVEFNVLVVVNSSNVEHPEDVLRWLVKQGFDNLQFIPCAEPLPGHPFIDGMDSASPGTITPKQYGEFLKRIFDAWVSIGIDRVRMRGFDNLIQMLWGQPAEMCELATECGYVVLEHNGDCYPCDFFVEPEWLLGNVNETPLGEMIAGEKFAKFAGQKSQLNDQCGSCEWLTLCQGECPRYRITNEGRADGALPYFCPSFKMFFGSKYGRLEQLAESAGRQLGFPVPPGRLTAAERTSNRLPRLSPQEAMRMQGAPTAVAPPPAGKSVGRNDPCPCGSGKKYKRCHG